MSARIEKRLSDRAAEANGFTIQGSKAQISNVNKDATAGVITFDAVGVTPSDQRGDGSITASNSGVTFSQSVSVIVPKKIAIPHDTSGNLVIGNRALNKDTSPAIPDIPSSKVLLVTIYMRFLTITVTDQFDEAVGDLYLGAEITEIYPGQSEIAINQALTASSTYTDPVGRAEHNGEIVDAGSTRAQDWINDAQIPMRPCLSETQNITVRVDGNELNPSIANRHIDTCPPSSVVITWP